MNVYISDKPLLSATGWRRATLAPSSAPGRVTVTLAEGPQAGTQLSVRPDGTEETGPHGVDGPWEQAQQIGDRIVYDYAGMIAPTVYDLMVRA